MHLLTLLFPFLLSSHQNIKIHHDPIIINKNVLLHLINNARKKGCMCGTTYYSPIFPLTWNDKLEKAARDHSNDMFLKKYFSHLDSNGFNGGDRLTNAGYNWKFYGENIAEGYTTEQQVVKGWLQSAEHCKNIMNPHFAEMGVGRAGNYWTMDFGSR